MQDNIRHDDLRRRAEEQLAGEPAVEGLTPADLVRALHELSVHQVELELQNEQLLETQVELERTRARYFDLYEFAPVGYLTLDDAGRIVDANHTASRLLRQERPSILGTRLSAFAAAADQDALYLFLRGAHEQDHPRTCELQLRAAGPPAWLRLDAMRAGDPGAEATRVTLADITEQRRLEAELLELNDHLEELVAQRTTQLEATGRELEAFAYSAAHDLRAPLRAIDGFSKLVAESAADRLDEAEQGDLQRVRAAAQRMAVLIDHLMNLARASRHDLATTPVDVSALAAVVCAEVCGDPPARPLELAIAPHLAAQTNEAMLRAVLTGLVENAWKFTSRHETTRVEIGAEEVDRETVFFVRDDGAGFDVAEATRLFGPFQRYHSPEEFPGDGIGLATVQRLVTRLGGRVWAEAEVERGATFFFTLGEADG